MGAKKGCALMAAIDVEAPSRFVGSRTWRDGRMRKNQGQHDCHQDHSVSEWLTHKELLDQILCERVEAFREGELERLDLLEGQILCPPSEGRHACYQLEEDAADRPEVGSARTVAKDEGVRSRPRPAIGRRSDSRFGRRVVQQDFWADVLGRADEGRLWRGRGGFACEMVGSTFSRCGKVRCLGI